MVTDTDSAPDLGPCERLSLRVAILLIGGVSALFWFAAVEAAEMVFG